MAAAYRVRRKEPFHALEVSGWCAVALIHVTTTDPFREGRHSNLVTHAVVANRSPDRMRAMAVIIARERRVVSARISNTVMNGVMPIVIVIGGNSIPPAVMRLQRVVCPTLTSICVANCGPLPSEPQRPHVRRVRVGDTRLDRLRSLRWRRRLSDSIQLRKNIFDLRIAFHSGHIGTRRQCSGNLAAAFH